MTLIFACRRYRLRDIGLIRRGAVSAGHNLRVMILPWAIPLLLLAALMRLFGKPIYVIVSDKQIGDSLIGYLFGRDSTRMMWNYADEWRPSGIRLPRHKVCFFREAGHNVDEFVFAPQPLAVSRAERKSPSRHIVFLGDVTAEFPIPRGAAWWRSRFAEMHEAFGYSFYLRTEFETLISAELTLQAHRRLARVLAKNLLRLWIVQAVHGHFGKRLILVGSNWRSFGISSESSLYNEEKRLEFYRSATVNLDCGSNSGGGAIYPRSSELITFSGGLMQVRCADTDAIFAERGAEFSFDNGIQVIERIESRLMEPPGHREERDTWLVERLRDRELLMQHSINRMLHHSDPLC
jgi:hypothetical protein